MCSDTFVGVVRAEQTFLHLVFKIALKLNLSVQTFSPESITIIFYVGTVACLNGKKNHIISSREYTVKKG